MNKNNLMRPGIRWTLIVACGVGVVLGGLELAEKESSPNAEAGGNEPAQVEHLKGSSLSRVTLTDHAAERIGLETATVRGQKGRLIVPYAAVLYDRDGKTWVYASRKGLTFVRANVEVEDISGELAVLSAGPRVGTSVATVGVAELYGTEFEVGH
ncbi:MAG: hypothetical protein AABM30_07375 [Actinomycetota bacterium]